MCFAGLYIIHDRQELAMALMPIDGRMDQQNGVTMQQTLKSQEVLMHVTAWVGLEISRSVITSQTQKVTDCVIFI